ncbi:amino acid adenylation domain-containing protein [Aquimarina sp. MAR_2010_214]|uniref:non-ribosomal peptide synthetase n=1 Tax=Aquimarina sp. MAR_2010_214 TaxID=1250026 RepID=UPI000C70DBA6|nr:non-ribosomal peptide synthetase [Aquimarina sp. MAR_2010_214]PKV49529.1 amino acid adenylation domain-containing protein [Aquimarina sp. MAR_2010_214]
MMNEVALTGISLRCSEADTIPEFLDIISKAKVCMVQPTKERLEIGGIPLDKEYFPFGYLKRVDQFDHEFFKISKSEADAIDPMYRILLELVCEAIENSGYSLDIVSKKKTGLFVTTNQSFYNLMYQSSQQGLDFTGKMPAMAAGRIAHLLNIKGPVFSIDTACSSSLVAVHEAIQKLKTGEIDIAIVGGARVLFEFYERKHLVHEDIAILAQDGQCRAFDNEANGTSTGEGAAVVVLKRKEDALKDEDHIYSILRGSEVNHDGARSNGLTAPSPVAQKELLLCAAEKSGVPLRSIGYIETHGTGTKLGDPIEYKAIKEAFEDENEEHQVRLGTLKPNIGHLDNMSGLFGLVKASLTLKEKKFFPLANFDTLNELITPNSHVVIEKAGATWSNLQRDPRRAGVSSFGMSGTNAHVILEEYQPNKLQKESNQDQEPLWIKLSAKNAASLEEYISRAKQFLKQEKEECLGDVTFTFNQGRTDYPYRIAFSGSNKEELLMALDVQLKSTSSNSQLPKVHQKIACLLLSDELSKVDVDNFNQGDGGHFYAKAQQTLGQKVMTEALGQTIAYQSALYGHLQSKGFHCSHIICNGYLAKKSKELIESGYCNIDSGVEKPINEPINWDRLAELLIRLSEQNIALIVVGKNENNLNRLTNMAQEQKLTLVRAVDTLNKGWENFWASCYNAGFSFDWDAFYPKGRYQKRVVPTYPFQKTSCWNPIRNLLFNEEVQEESANDQSFDLSETEEKVVLEILKKTLQNEKVTLTDDFFDLGGNSIVGTQFINRINDLYEIIIEFDELYECYEIGDIVSLVKERRKEAEKPVTTPTILSHKEKTDYFPLTNTQLRFWIDSQTPQGLAAYNINMNVRIKGMLQETVLNKAFEYLIRQHENFRLLFVMNESGEVVQKLVQPDEIQFTLEKTDVSGNSDAVIQEFITQVYHQPFDLEKGLLLRAKLLRLGAEEVVLVMSFHHLIFDGWSAGIFLNQLVTHYQQLLVGVKPSPVVGPTYTDYLKWFAENTTKERMLLHRNYWKEKLSGEVSQLDLGQKREQQSFNGKKEKYLIDREVCSQLEALAIANRTTLFVTLLTSIRSYLYRLSGQNIIIGTPISGRMEKRFEQLLGLFLNTLPLKTKIHKNGTMIDCLKKERDTVTGALQHQVYPYDAILDDKNHHKEAGFSLFNVLVVLQNQNQRFDIVSDASVDLPFQISPGYEVNDTPAQFDLTFTFHQTVHALELELCYNTDAFTMEMIKSLMHNFQFFLSQLLENPNEKISAIKLVRPEEKLQILALNEKPSTSSGMTLLDLFQKQVEQHPENVAIKFGYNILNYKELNRISDEMAMYLSQQYAPKTDDLIAVELVRSEWLPVTILGILKTGAAYLPIDPGYPKARIDFLKQDSQCRMSVDETELQKFMQQRAHQCDNYQVPEIDEEQLAYIIYTSGTTGLPKGVMIEHKSIVNYLQHQSVFFEVDEQDTFLWFSSMSFDASVEQLFLPLVNGAKLFIPTKEQILDTTLFETLLVEEQISHLHGVPSFLRTLRYKPEMCLKRIVSGGEPFDNKVWDTWQGKVQLYNKYGPTEATITTLETEVNETVLNLRSIGRPIRNSTCYILDTNGSLQPIGMVGEICLGGSCLARGYFGLQDLTEQKFVPHPLLEGERLYKTGDLGRWLPDDSVQYIGRVDNQVKIRGHRIELEEISYHLQSFNQIQEATVIAQELKPEELELVAYFVGPQLEDTSDLHDYLAERLPFYMIPSYYLNMKSLPLTAHGKIDRHSLPLPSDHLLTDQRSYVAPSTATEKTLAKIWETSLEIEKVGVKDNFFMLGGNSIKAIKVIFQINKAFSLNLSINTLFIHPKLADLAAYIDFEKKQLILTADKSTLNEIEL